MSEKVIRVGEIETIVSLLKRLFQEVYGCILSRQLSLSYTHKRQLVLKLMERMYSDNLKTILKELSFNPYGPFVLYINHLDREPILILIMRHLKKWQGETVAVNLDPLHFKLPKKIVSKYQYSFILNLEKNDVLWENPARLINTLKTLGIPPERMIFTLTRRHYIIENLATKIFKIPYPTEDMLVNCMLYMNKSINKGTAYRAAGILDRYPARIAIESLIKTMEDLGLTIEI